MQWRSGRRGLQIGRALATAAGLAAAACVEAPTEPSPAPLLEGDYVLVLDVSSVCALPTTRFQWGVQARTVVEFQLGRAYDKFAATIGIDDAVRPRGSVVFRVESGSRVLFESGTVTGRDAPRNVTIDVADIDTLTLVVDFADGIDLSDHANWCDARLIKPPAKP